MTISGSFRVHLVPGIFWYFSGFGIILSRKIWQPWNRRATTRRETGSWELFSVLLVTAAPVWPEMFLKPTKKY
jgi:hypothetical protein